MVYVLRANLATGYAMRKMHFTGCLHLENDIPVFMGHYWLEGIPALQRSNVVCLDYSVANGGKLVAYQFNGEKELREESLIY